MKRIISKTDLVLGLRRLGLREGMGVEVHSSLSSFGFVEGGADTVITALMEVIGTNGAIAMPSFRMSKRLPLSPEDRAIGITLKIKITDSDTTEPTGMGIIADTFRQRSDVLTSSKEVIRSSAWGADKKENSENCFAYMIEHDQWALLLGVDIYGLSAMHAVEDKLPAKIRSAFKASKEIHKIYLPNQWWVETGIPNNAWLKIQEKAYKQGKIKDTCIGDSRCMFFKIHDVIDLHEEALIQDPFGLYDLD